MNGSATRLARNRDIELPKPSLASYGTVAAAFAERRTLREIGARRCGRQVLSNLLYAACGVNRPQGPFGALGLTAASASNSQEIDVYVALEGGAYRFEPGEHVLRHVSSQDVRRHAFNPRQPARAPAAAVELVFVVDVSRLEHTRGFEEPGLHDPEVQKSYYFVDTGIIAANVYLFAGAAGLACWFHNCDRQALARVLDLKASQRVLFAQTVGYPATLPK
ncbi:MAG TPA: nitroreductase family protein [Polyangiaceae bacterium]|nr:nitroreductase family protein [Polyangiaceae bacterium]